MLLAFFIILSRAEHHARPIVCVLTSDLYIFAFIATTATN